MKGMVVEIDWKDTSQGSRYWFIDTVNMIGRDLAIGGFLRAYTMYNRYTINHGTPVMYLNTDVIWKITVLQEQAEVAYQS